MQLIIYILQKEIPVIKVIGKCLGNTELEFH